MPGSFFNKVAGLRPKISNNTFSYRTPPVACFCDLFSLFNKIISSQQRSEQKNNLETGRNINTEIHFQPNINSLKRLTTARRRLRTTNAKMIIARMYQ